MFAEDIDRLPAGTVQSLASDCLEHGQSAYDLFDELFQQMNSPTPAAGGRLVEDYTDDPLVQEITSLIHALSEDESMDLVALTCLECDNYTAEDWTEVRAEAGLVHNQRTAAYLLGMPQLGDFLEEGFSLLGYSCEEFEINRL